MIRKKKFHWKKPLFDAAHAARCDVIMQRPKDNPYREGSSEHATYEKSYEATAQYLKDHNEPAGNEPTGKTLPDQTNPR